MSKIGRADRTWLHLSLASAHSG